MVEKGVVEEGGYVEEENEGSLKRRRTSSRLYSICRKASHNTKTYLEVREIDSSSESK
jgi:hypothetical protein